MGILAYLVLIIGQLGKHFWPDWSFVYGIKIDYLSPILYFLDLVWFGLFLIGLSKRKKNNLFTAKNVFWLVLVLINIMVADRWQISVYKWFRIWQFWWWVKYIRANRVKVLSILPGVICWWVVFEFILSLGQVVKGGSLGGIFYWLGERRFSYMTPGIARISWFGDNFIRAYGTFSHPNSLAGFLLVAVLLLSKVKKIKKVWFWVINWLVLVTIILSGSRLVWLVIGILFISRVKLKTGVKLLFLGIFLMFLGALAEFKINWIGGWSSDSLSARINLNKIALSMLGQSPMFGVGGGNFLVKLPDKLSGFWIMQPVHNIFLLALAEFGLAGFAWLGLFLKKRINWNKFSLIWLVVFLTGMFDHYWLTLPQNIYLLSVVMGLSMK